MKAMLLVLLVGCGAVSVAEPDGAPDAAELAVDAAPIDVALAIVDAPAAQADAPPVDADSCNVDEWTTTCDPIVSCSELFIGGCPVCELAQENGFSTYQAGRCCVAVCCMALGWECAP